MIHSAYMPQACHNPHPLMSLYPKEPQPLNTECIMLQRPDINKTNLHSSTKTFRNTDERMSFLYYCWVSRNKGLRRIGLTLSSSHHISLKYHPHFIALVLYMSFMADIYIFKLQIKLKSKSKTQNLFPGPG